MVAGVGGLGGCNWKGVDNHYLCLDGLGVLD